jgi:hypothetical protein
LWNPSDRAHCMEQQQETKAAMGVWMCASVRTSGHKHFPLIISRSSFLLPTHEVIRNCMSSSVFARSANHRPSSMAQRLR